MRATPRRRAAHPGCSPELGGTPAPVDRGQTRLRGFRKRWRSTQESPSKVGHRRWKTSDYPDCAMDVDVQVSLERQLERQRLAT